MDWVKVSTSADSHPQMLAAGWWGREVFFLVLRVSGNFRLNGRLPEHYRDPAFLADFWRLDPDLGEPCALINRGLNGAISAGLLRRDAETGDLIIDGWERAYGLDPTHAERQRRYRERQQKARDGSDASRPVTVTQSRAEQKRSESTPPQTPPLPRGEARAAEVQEVFADWRSRCGGIGPAKAGKAQASHIRARLEEGWSVEDLKRALAGVAVDIQRWPERAAHLGIEVIFRSSDQVARFVRMAPGPEPPAPPTPHSP